MQTPEELEQRVIDLTAEVDEIVAQIQHLKSNPPTDVDAAQRKVEAAIAELRAEKSKPTTWSSRTKDMYAQMREHLQLEEAVRNAKRDLAIAGKLHFDAIAQLQFRLYEARKLHQIAVETRDNGGVWMFTA